MITHAAGAPSVPTIYAAMASILAEFPVVTKDRKNPSQGYSFRGIDDVYLAAHDIIAKHRVFPAPTDLHHYFEPASDTKSGTKQVRCVVSGILRFYATDGSYVDVSIVGEGIDSGDKALMKAISNAVKYGYWNTFCVPSVEKKDSEAFDDDLEEPVSFEPRSRR